MWVEARGRLVKKGWELDNLKDLARVVREAGNIAGKPNVQRPRWGARLPFFGDISAKRRADMVYFVGCVASFYPMVQDIARCFARTLALAKLDFTLLGGEEKCCGYPLISAGHLDQAILQMKQNIQAVRETGAQTLVVTCPGCYRMWKHEYHRLTGESLEIEVFHSTELLWQLIRNSRIQLGTLDNAATYHDPCDLGRVSGIYDPPRSIINSVRGIDYIELEENRERSVCCGSGGDLLSSNQELSLALARKRLDQAHNAGVDTVVTACPSCVRGMTMAKTAAKMQLAVLDIAQFAWKAARKQDG
jgi:Fe-S oxidoreductase